MRVLRIIAAAVLACGLFTGTAPLAVAADWYFRPFEDCTRIPKSDGRSYGTAWCKDDRHVSSRRGVDWTAMSAGDRLVICGRHGSQHYDAQLEIPLSIVIDGDCRPGERGILASTQWRWLSVRCGTAVSIRNVEFRGGWNAVDASLCPWGTPHRLEVIGCQFRNVTGIAIRARACHDCLFAKNTFHGVVTAIYLLGRGERWSASYVPRNVKIVDNVIADGDTTRTNGDDHAIAIQGGVNLRIERNQFSNVPGSCLSLWYSEDMPVRQVRVEDNRCRMPGIGRASLFQRGGMSFGGESPGDPSRISDIIFRGNTIIGSWRTADDTHSQYGLRLSCYRTDGPQCIVAGNSISGVRFGLWLRERGRTQPRQLLATGNRLESGDVDSPSIVAGEDEPRHALVYMDGLATLDRRGVVFQGNTFVTGPADAQPVCIGFGADLSCQSAPQS